MRFGLLFVALGCAVACGKDGAPASSGSAGQSGASGSSPGGATAGTEPGSAGVAGLPKGGASTSGAAGAAGTGGDDAEAGAGSSASTEPPFGHPDPSVTHPHYDGFTLWVVEDFSEPLDLKTDPIWTYSDGGFQTHRFTRDAITFEPGKMVLTLSEEKQTSSCSYSAIGVVPERSITSGELRSKHNWFRYGRYEASLKVPSVKPNDPITNGNYITSLFTYRQPGCQEWREIDLEVTGDGPGHLGTNLITADQDCNFSSDKEQPQFFDLPGSFRTDFRTIGFEWLPTVITFYYLDANGQPVVLRKLTGPKVPQLSAKIMANLWVFDASFAFGGPLGANNEYPFRAEYDFIRFYKWDADAQYPCADMSADCLTPEDTDLTGNNACDGVPVTGDLQSCGQCGTVVRMICTEACE